MESYITSAVNHKLLETKHKEYKINRQLKKNRNWENTILRYKIELLKYESKRIDKTTAEQTAFEYRSGHNIFIGH